MSKHITPNYGPMVSQSQNHGKAPLIKRHLDNFSPLKLAVWYAFLASTTTYLAASLDGVAIENQYIIIEGRNTVIHSYMNNYSTIIDFLFLNPLTIYFLQSSMLKIIENYKQREIIDPVAPYHRYGLAAVSVTAAAAAMYYYYQNFLDGDFYDAVIFPVSDGRIRISLTGWVIYFWTSSFLSFILYRSADYFYYLRYIISLSSDDIIYQPFHEDSLGGLGKYAKPMVYYFSAMFCLLMIFTIFIIYDKIIFDIDESNRLYGFILYLIVIFPAFFLPLWHIHKLMKKGRENYFSGLNLLAMPFQEMINSTSKNTGAALEINSYLQSLETIGRCRRLISDAPVWPVATSNLLVPVGSVVAALYPITEKLILLMLDHAK